MVKIHFAYAPRWYSFLKGQSTMKLYCGRDINKSSWIFEKDFIGLKEDVCKACYKKSRM